ncbi:MAG: hypothetical protein P8M67_01145 [Opitutales bacterium]|nr:hypothetical protein [Opitutales bacterium]
MKSNMLMHTMIATLLLSATTYGEKPDSLSKFADPFYGNAGVDMPPPPGVAAAWNWEKAQTGNTHPGPQMPFGMMSVVPYTGAYPSGSGFNKATSRRKARYMDGLRGVTFGFTHMQQSGCAPKYFDWSW